MMITKFLPVYFALSTVFLLSEAQIPPIDSFLKAQMKEFQIPGIAVAVIDNGEVAFLETYGKASLEHHAPVSKGTAFQLASVTKLISATAIMYLVQEEKLDLNQRVRYYLPELPLQWDDMKVMDLVAHQSGIADLLALKHNFTSVAEALDSAASLPLDFAPGTKTVYAAGDYAVVMQLIERVAGMPFAKFLQTELLNKLNMTHTRYNNMEQDFIYRTYDTIPFAATVYKWDKEKSQQRVFSMMFPSWTYPSGGLFSSIEDLSKWIVSLDKNTLLKPEYSEKMWTPATLRDGSTSPFGVGWIVDQYKGEKATGHSGGPALADIVRLPERKITAIVLTNQLELRPFLTMKVLDLYLANTR